MIIYPIAQEFTEKAMVQVALESENNIHLNFCCCALIHPKTLRPFRLSLLDDINTIRLYSQVILE